MPCEKCVYGEQGPVDPNNIGAPRPILCKRFPPTPIAIPTNQGLGFMSAYPQVSGDNECFEFKLKDPQ